MLARSLDRSAFAFEVGLQRCRLVATSLALLSALAAPSPAAAGARVLRELVTPTFRVISTLDERKTRRIASDIAAFEDVIVRSSGSAPLDAAGTDVYIVSNMDWSQTFRPRSTTERFLFEGLSNSIVLPTYSAQSDCYPIVFHQYSHYLLHSRSTIAWPPWFDEGLADLVSNAQFNADRITLTLPETHLDILARLPWLPLRTMLTVERSSPEFKRHRLVDSFYAQSWLMMHYAFIGRPELRRQVVDFALRMNWDEPLETAVQGAFGKSVEELDRELHAYSKRPAFRDGEVTIAPNREILNTPMRELSNGAAEMELAALALRLDAVPERIKRLLTVALRERPGEPRAVAAMALVQVRLKDDASAQEYRARLESGRTALDARTSVLIGDSYHEQAERDHEPGRETEGVSADLYRTARTWYEAALGASPNDLEAIHRYAQTSLRLRENLDQARSLLEHALAVAPRDTTIALDLAQVHEATGDRAAAAPYWEAVARRTQGPELRQKALEALKALGVTFTAPVAAAQPGGDSYESSVRTASSSESPVPADSSAAPSAGSDAATNPGAAPAAQPDEQKEAAVDIVALQRAGYKIVNEKGTKLYCKRDQVFGSRLQFKTRCFTYDELIRSQNNAAEMLSEMSRKAPIPRGN